MPLHWKLGGCMHELQNEKSPALLLTSGADQLQSTFQEAISLEFEICQVPQADVLVCILYTQEALAGDGSLGS